MSKEFTREVHVTGYANSGEDSQGKVNYYLNRLQSCIEIWQDAFKGVAPCHNITITVKRRRLYEQERESPERATDKN